MIRHDLHRAQSGSTSWPSRRCSWPRCNSTPELLRGYTIEAIRTHGPLRGPGHSGSWRILRCKPVQSRRHRPRAPAGTPSHADLPCSLPCLNLAVLIADQPGLPHARARSIRRPAGPTCCAAILARQSTGSSGAGAGAIISLTIIVRLILMPAHLQAVPLRPRRCKQLQPKDQGAARASTRPTSAKLQEETMKLYQEVSESTPFAPRVCRCCSRCRSSFSLYYANQVSPRDTATSSFWIHLPSASGLRYLPALLIALHRPRRSSRPAAHRCSLADRKAARNISCWAMPIPVRLHPLSDFPAASCCTG